jgi:hypothetical protein
MHFMFYHSDEKVPANALHLNALSISLIGLLNHTWNGNRGICCWYKSVIQNTVLAHSLQSLQSESDTTVLRVNIFSEKMRALSLL